MKFQTRNFELATGKNELQSESTSIKLNRVAQTEVFESFPSVNDNHSSNHDNDERLDMIKV
jgi:hypothetical protein